MGIASFQLYIMALHLLMCKQANAIVGYTRLPLDGCHCSTGLYTDMGQIDQQACTRSCIISKVCVLLTHSHHCKTCKHLEGFEPCHQATTDAEIMMMRFRPSLDEQCVIPSHRADNRLVVSDTGVLHPITVYRTGFFVVFLGGGGCTVPGLNATFCFFLVYQLCLAQ